MSRTAPEPASYHPDWLAGGGEMGALIRAHDWSRTPLGPVGSWPPSLRTAVNVMLHSRFPMIIWWGPELRFLYNDAYRPIPGARHPWALGQPGAAIWPEIWHIIGPMLRGVLTEAEATWSDDQLLVLERYGAPEECYFTFSYSPIRDEGGRVGGVFAAVSETTPRVLGERRLRTLRDLGADAGRATSASMACELSMRTLAANRHDVPFALIYVVDEEGASARLCAATGLARGTPAAPEAIPLGDGAAGGWPLAAAYRDGDPVLVDDLGARFGPLPGGPWPVAATRGLVLPFRESSQARVAGVLVAGLSPYLAPGDDYRGFLGLVAGQIGAAVANARAYEEERRRAEALAELDRAKTAFFSSVSHEFRTPLTLMLGPIEEALAAADDPAGRARLDLVYRNALRLQKLVNTLLDFSRIEAGRLRARYVPTDLAALTAELASVFRSAVERAGLSYTVDCRPIGEPAFVDRDMWEKIVLNLASNAFKFTLDGAIEVRLDRAGDAARLVVRDTGSGIPSEQIPHIFERFHRVEGTRARTFEGTGIGLALVQELVRQHGGAIGVESEPGRGTTFTVTVPLGRDHLPADRVADAAEADGPSATALNPSHYVVEALRWLPGAVAAADRPDSGPEPTAPAGDRPRVLLADDNADMREYVRRLLADRFEVEAVADGAEALAAARARPPALVLTDVMMPRLDGFGLLAALRADPATAAIPVVMLSARAGEEAHVEGLAAGADDYLVKPFGARELVARVAARVEIDRLRREADAARRRAEAILASITDAFVALDADGRFTYLNDAALGLYGARREDLLGRDYREAFPATRGSVAEAEFRRAVAERTPVAFEYEYGPWGRWFDVRAFPAAAGGLSVYFRDVTDRRRADEERERLNRELKDADRRKDEFLAMLAHELRNPLAAMAHAAAVAAAAGPLADPLDWCVAVIARQARHLGRLIDDLLDVSRITRGMVRLRRDLVDAAPLFRQAAETVRPLVEERRHRLDVAIAPGLWVVADPTRLEQVAVNLLTNAARYTPPGGRIALAAAREGGEVVLRVADDGIGISPETLATIFELFAQGDRSIARSEGGLGIGLTIVRSLVELHGGAVVAESPGPGQGSTFTVRLPAAEAPATAQPSAPSPAPAAGGPSRRARVLVVDDSRDTARGLAKLLAMLGHEARVAHDGPGGLEAARAYRPELVLLDLGLPGMDGFEVARRLRAEPETAGARIVAVSGYGQDDDRRRAREAGFDHHLVKPVDVDALRDLLADPARA